MQDPQVNLKGVIVRINLRLGNESSGFGLNIWFQAHGLVWPMVLYVRKKCKFMALLLNFNIIYIIIFFLILLFSLL